MPSEPVSMAATSDSMSPNRLSVTMTSNCFGLAHELHGAVVGEHVLELDVGELARCAARVTTCVPQHARLHHVGLLGRGHLVAPLAGELEGDAGDALDLVRRVDLGVDGALLAVPRVSISLGSPK